MIIAGLQKNSLVDYRGKVAAVIFVPFCNFDCYYCHNRMLLETDPKKAKFQVIPEEEVLAFLEKRVGLLGGVVITGGEPTLHIDLTDFIKKVKALGFPVKLDTNGANPEVIQNLIQKGHIDAIAMDIKAPVAKYDDVCGTTVDMDKVKKSISIIMESDLDYEFRTTVTPEFTAEDIENTAALVKGCNRYILQQFRKPDPYNGFADIRNARKPYSGEFFDKAVKICRSYAREVLTRGVVL